MKNTATQINARSFRYGRFFRTTFHCCEALLLDSKIRPQALIKERASHTRPRVSVLCLFKDRYELSRFRFHTGRP
jgi:hypothetical protein